MPTFYDKLLQVPLLNLSIKGIDRLARSKWLVRSIPQCWADGGRPGAIWRICLCGASYSLE